MKASLRQRIAFLTAIILAPTFPLLGDETLLSRNATYRVVGEAYLYAGQHIPGTNDRAKNTSGYRLTPLVEITDTGDALIDGDTKTVVSTAWFWRRGGKRITVEMTLPGRSKVNRVAVRLPQDPTFRPQNIRLDVRQSGARWKQVELIQTGPEGALAPAETRKASHTFILPQIECDEIRVMCVDQAIAIPHCGIAEIEVYGSGPTESNRRGLERSEPHIRSITPPKPSRPEGSRPFVQKDTTLQLSGSSVTFGHKALLVDGDRSTLIRVKNKRFADTTLIVEIDLGEALVIDAVNVWLPGGKGVETGHVNDVQLAISSSRNATDWQIPADRVVNPYWPDDDAPKPYPIAIGNLDTVGRRIRVTASLTGTGGRTSRLALSEVEVWGRPVDPSKKSHASASLSLQPITFPPEPLSKIRPQLRWMLTEKIRSGRIKGNLFDPFPTTEQTKGEVLRDAGFNLILCLMTPDRNQRTVSSELAEKLPENVAAAKALGLRYAVVWQYGSTHQEPYRRYLGPDGTEAKKSCCPLDSKYFERHVAKWAIQTVQGGADGLVIDTEMYESDQTRYPGPCICDECFMVYLKRFSTGANALFEQVTPARRGLWLATNDAMDHYTRFTAQRSEKLWDGLRARCQELNPAFFFGHGPFLEYLPGIERGLGTATAPCLLFSGHEYTYGIRDVTYRKIRTIRDNYPALYICGFFLHYHSPAMVEEHGLVGSLYADGWWLYHMMHLLNNVTAAESHLATRAKGTSSTDYFRKTSQLLQRFHQLRSLPSHGWPRPEGLPKDFPLPVER